VSLALREARDLARSFAVALPPAIVVAWRPVDPWAPLALSLVASFALAWWGRAALRRRLRTVSAVLAAYRDGDFSIRARKVSGADAPLHEVLEELNELGETLRRHRLGEMEAWGLLQKVMSEVDVVVLAVDDDGRVRLANAAAARVLGKTAAVLVGQRLSELELDLHDVLSGPAPRIVRGSPALGAGPWELRRGGFRLAGEPHTLVVLADVSSALRESERDAWRRLIRVIGHEINNSLSPIQSMSENLLAELAKAEPRRETFESDLAEALGVIARRAAALARFMASYSRLARLPAPQLSTMTLAPVVDKVALLERRLTVEVARGPDVTVVADVDQIEQVLINLVKNAADAAEASVRMSWTADDGYVDIAIEDDGPGVGDTTNLFVPFFTTKPGGSGIGLVLSREIVEAHKGQLTLGSRSDARGAIARVRLPRAG
jgi:nitrogen fixation/metabolism regulation signal transduction histidine kinase